MSDGNIDRHVRHLVGIATLRRLHRMVDADNAGEADATMWAKRLGVVFTILAVVFVAGLAFKLH